jgi:hypothetical protein
MTPTAINAAEIATIPLILAVFFMTSSPVAVRPSRMALTSPIQASLFLSCPKWRSGFGFGTLLRRRSGRRRDPFMGAHRGDAGAKQSANATFARSSESQLRGLIPMEDFVA